MPNITSLEDTLNLLLIDTSRPNVLHILDWKQSSFSSFGVQLYRIEIPNGNNMIVALGLVYHQTFLLLELLKVGGNEIFYYSTMTSSTSIA